MPARAAAKVDHTEADEFGIGEVAARIGVKPSVIRYWEQEVLTQRPAKSGAVRRRYEAADIALLEQVKQLLYTERLTVDGARRRLGALRRSDLPVAANLGDQGRIRTTLVEIRHELESLQRLLA